MRLFRSTLAFTATLLVLSAGSAFAQQRGGMMLGRDAMLLSNEGVIKELKLDSAQTEKMNALAAQTREKAQGEMVKIRDLPQEERSEKVLQVGKSIREDIKKSLSDFLKPDQLKRYEQISLQSRGYEALADPEIQDKLKLTDEQKSKMKELGASAQQKMTELRSGFQNDRQGTMTKMQEVRKETTTKAAALLSESQKATWKDMTGAPIEIQFGPPRNA